MTGKELQGKNIVVVNVGKGFTKALTNFSIPEICNMRAPVHVSCIAFDNFWLVTRDLFSIHIPNPSNSGVEVNR